MWAARLRTRDAWPIRNRMWKLLQANDLRNRIGGTLFGFSGSAFIVFMLLADRWTGLASASPDPVNGRIVPHNEHGKVTYLTAFQSTGGALLFWIVVLAGLLALAIMPKRDVAVRGWRGFVPGANWKIDDPKGLAGKSALYGAVLAPSLVVLLGPVLVGWLNRLGLVLNF